MSKKKMRKERALIEITRQKAKRRGGIMMTALGGIIAVLVILGIPVLQGNGILPYGDMAVSIVTFASAIVACGVLGLGVQKFTRASNAINAVRRQYGITDEEMRDL